MNTVGPPHSGVAKPPVKIVCHSSTVLKLAASVGWFAGASYLRLRDIRGLSSVGFIDIDWKNYNFDKHLGAVREHRPLLTVARDLTHASDLSRTLTQAYELLKWSKFVIIVPKDLRLGPKLSSVIPEDFIIGYSVPTRYGGTGIPLQYFRGRKVHLLGGRPEVQRRIAHCLDIFSLDINRFTLDAKFGDYFDGEIFRPHPVGGYYRCLRDSIRNIEALWDGYKYEG